MNVEDKLDKIIDLLIAQNNLLTSMMLSLRQPSLPSAVGNFNMPQAKAGNIKAEIEQKIEAARREAQIKISQAQATIPELNSTVKAD